MEARPLDADARVRLVPAATRAIGSDLLVNAGGATGTVERLAGSAPELYRSFGDGLTIAEAAERLAAHTTTPVAEVQEHALAFAAALLRSNLAERAF